MLGRAALLALVGLTLAGCSGSVSIGSSSELDTPKLEQALVEAAGKALPEFTVDNGSCPETVKREKGGTFSCTVDVDGQPLRYDVVQDDAEGNVTYTKAQAVLDVAKLEALVAEQVQEQAAVEVTLSCPGDKVLVKDVGATFTCDAMQADGTSSPFTITVKDVEGNISFDG